MDSSIKALIVKKLKDSDLNLDSRPWLTSLGAATRAVDNHPSHGEVGRCYANHRFG